MTGGALILILAAGLAVPMKNGASIELRSPEIRLRDVVDLRTLDAAARARYGPRIIARIPQGRHRITLSSTALARLVRRSVPIIEPVGLPGEVTFTLVQSPRRGSGCSALARPVAQGEALDPNDLVGAPCGEASAQLRFDRRSNALRAEIGLPAGASVGRVVAPPPPAVEAGAKLTLLSTSGPVRVERSVTALQSGRPGGRIFVQSADGHVMSVPVALRDPGEVDR